MTVKQAKVIALLLQLLTLPLSFLVATFFNWDGAQFVGLDMVLTFGSLYLLLSVTWLLRGGSYE